LADDLGFSDLGSYGSEIDTPNLDSLAAKGVRFSNFYNAAMAEKGKPFNEQIGLGFLTRGGLILT
jgi:hypothetical protein